MVVPEAERAGGGVALQAPGTFSRSTLAVLYDGLGGEREVSGSYHSPPMYSWASRCSWASWTSTFASG